MLGFRSKTGGYKPNAGSDTASFLNSADERNITAPNVIVFGETGAGKSSVVNMLDGADGGGTPSNDKKAEISSDAKGVTFQNTRYEKRISDLVFNIFDTVGLNEASKGQVPAEQAIRALYGLISNLDGGVSLLVYVMRASRITEVVKDNYKLFYETFCEGQVPVVIALTGLENEDDMDAWWPRNKDKFNVHDMSFQGSACITATRGKCRDEVYVFDEEYKKSKEKVERLIFQSASKDPWRMPRKPWFAAIVIRLRNIFAKVFKITPGVVATSLYDALVDYGKMSREDALSLASKY